MTQFLLVLVGLVIGIVAGAFGYKYWDELQEGARDAADRVRGQDPEDVQRRMNSAGTFVRKYALVLVLGVLVVCIVGTVLVANIQPRTVQLGGFIRLTDKCGVEHNVQIEAAHVAQGFVLVAPGTECELKQPLGVPK